MMIDFFETIHESRKPLSVIEERRKKVALALKKKVIDETSVMAGGAVEGGPTKPAFGSATKKKREPHQKLKGRRLEELNEAQLNEIFNLANIKQYLEKLKQKFPQLVNLNIPFLIKNGLSIINAIKDIIAGLKSDEQLGELKKRKRPWLAPLMNKYGVAISGVALAIADQKFFGGVVPLNIIMPMIASKISADDAISKIENLDINAITSMHQAAANLISEKNPAIDPKKFHAQTAVGSAGTGATGLEDEEEVIVEYLTEEESKKKTPRLGKVTRNPSGSKKKFHVYVKCSGRVKKISFGDPNLSIKRDSPERRKSFRARHKCDKPEGKNRCTARYWSCYQWRAGAKVKSEE